MQKLIYSRYILVARPWALEDEQNDAQIGVTKDWLMSLPKLLGIEGLKI